MDGSPRRGAWVALVVITGCHWAAGGYGGGVIDEPGGDVAACRESRRPPPGASAAPPPAHSDFARLRAYRSYFRIARTGDLADHFLVRLDCGAAAGALYAVLPDGTVHWERADVLGRAPPPDEPPAVPDDKRALAERVRAQYDADYADGAIAAIEYLGAYREVIVEEDLPVTPPGDPYARRTQSERAFVPMNADLSAIVGEPQLERGAANLCSHDAAITDCGSARWMDYTIAPTGTPQLAALVTDGSPQPAAERARFRTALIAAARGATLAKLDALLARQGDGLLPPGVSTTIQVGFAVIARLREEPAAGHLAELRVALPAGALARGTTRGRASTRLDGVDLTLTIEATPERPAPAHGAARLRVHFRYRLEDGRGNVRTGDVIDEVALIADGDAAAVWSLGRAPGVTYHYQQPPIGQRFPGGPTSGQLTADFQVTWDVEPWWPP